MAPQTGRCTSSVFGKSGSTTVHHHHERPASFVDPVWILWVELGTSHKETPAGPVPAAWHPMFRPATYPRLWDCSQLYSYILCTEYGVQGIYVCALNTTAMSPAVFRELYCKTNCLHIRELKAKTRRFVPEKDLEGGGRESINH